jgi:hypothetical protein
MGVNVAVLRGCLDRAGALAFPIRHFRIPVIGAAACLAACLETPANTPDPARHAPPRDTLLVEPFDLAAISERLAAHRGVALRSAVAFAAVDENAWSHSLDALAGRSADAALFPFGVPPTDEASANLSALFAKGVAALYDRRTKAVLLHRHDDRPERARAWTIVHELEHALQDQSSKLRHASGDADEQLAFRAAVEGDAEITTAAFIASRGLANDHWLARLLALMSAPSAAQDSFGGAPEFIRRQWVFPYIDGAVFVGALYRAGGYPLVDRMFQRPPVSTAQVLHPDKYLAGELPIPVPIPEAPVGFTETASGRMGELRTRALLAPCDASPIDDAGTGWGGDAYAILAGAGPGPALLWSSIWGDGASAQRFVDVARARDACVRSRIGAGAVMPPATIERDGDRVAYVLGLPPEASALSARALLGVPVERPSAEPPLGAVHLAALADPDSFIAQGTVHDGRYVSGRLGLSLSVQGFDVADTMRGQEISIEEAYGMTALRLTIVAVMSAWMPDLEQRMAWDLVGAVEEAGVPIVYMGEMAIATGAGPARALRWSRGEGTNAALVLVPVCDGKITLAITAGGGGPQVWDDIQRVGRRLRFNEASPACRFAREDAPSP